MSYLLEMQTRKTALSGNILRKEKKLTHRSVKVWSTSFKFNANKILNHKIILKYSEKPRNLRDSGKHELPLQECKNLDLPWKTITAENKFVFQTIDHELINKHDSQ